MMLTGHWPNTERCSLWHTKKTKAVGFDSAAFFIADIFILLCPICFWQMKKKLYLIGLSLVALCGLVWLLQPKTPPASLKGIFFQDNIVQHLQWATQDYFVKKVLKNNPLASAESFVNGSNTLQNTLSTVFEKEKWVNQERSTHYYRLFTEQKGKALEAALGLFSTYSTDIFAQLAQKQMPEWLGYLPLVLSGCANTVAQETQRAGIWQLSVPTALHYGLRVDHLVDERLDPKVATQAAIKHLAALYQQHNDWAMAVTAFCTSPAQINRLVLREQSADFTQIYKVLDKQSRDFVHVLPAFECLLNSPANKLLLEKNNALMLVETTQVKLTQKCLLSVVAQSIHVELGLLKRLNPSLVTDVVPLAQKSGFYLTIPKESAEIFDQNIEKIYKNNVKIPDKSALITYTMKTDDQLADI